MEIFQIHTAQMTKFKKIDQSVDLNDLAKRTRNFTGAEIESVVRSAQATAMNRLIEVSRMCRRSQNYSTFYFHAGNHSTIHFYFVVLAIKQ